MTEKWKSGTFIRSDHFEDNDTSTVEAGSSEQGRR